MRKVICAIAFCCLFTSPGRCLDQARVNSVRGSNCTSYIYKQRKSGGNGSITSNVNQSLQCPPWQLPSHNVCKWEETYHQVLSIQPGTQQTLLLPFYCMTTSESPTEHRDVLGGCLFSTVLEQKTRFFPLPCNISELNKFMCADLNREGQLCGSCQDGYAPPVYSYALHCVNCTDYGYQNWLKYVAVAFGPLTVFCVIIIVFHISATSPYLHGYILFCQLFSLPIIYRLFLTSHGYMYYKGTRWSVKIYSSFIGIWNLDFFRLVYEPFCLHPDMSVIQTLILDYLVALYPLLLVAITYSLVYLYGRNCKVVVLLWKPLRRILRPLFHDLDIRATLIESFSTLYLLSVVKIQSVSLDLLVPTPLYYSGGTQDSPYYLYLAPDVVYFGDTHLPYALVALVLSVALVIFPTLLLFLYPCQCFQTFLNKINCNSQVLRTYMDVLQGHYKNGTDNTRDFRYFSGVFLVVRIVSIIQFSLFNSYFSIITLGLCVTVLTFTVAILHPQRCHTHYILDSVFLSFLSVILFYTIGASTGTHNTVPSLVLMGLGIVSITSPQFYFIGLILYWTIRKKKIPQRIWAAIQRRINTDNHLINAVE
jgi:hypothetical protein